MSDFERPGQTPPPPPPPWGSTDSGSSPFPPQAPPPPPSYGTPPPPPTYGGPAPYPGSPSGQVPAGYVAYGQPGGPVNPPNGLRVATIILFWVQAGLTLLLGLVAYNRGEVVNGFNDGSKSLSDVQSADDAVGGVAAFVLIVGIALIVVLCIWAHHTVRNAKRRDPALNVSPGMAAGGWFIPIGNFWLPWMHLRRGAKRFGGPVGALNVWQALTIIGGVFAIIGRGFGTSFDNADNLDDLAGIAHSQGIFFVLAGLFYIATTIFAMKAMKSIDAATSGS